MTCDGHVLYTYMAMFSQSDHLIGLKFYQHQYVTILFNPNNQDLNMNFTKSSSLDRKSTRLNSSHERRSRMPSSA